MTDTDTLALKLKIRGGKNLSKLDPADAGFMLFALSKSHAWIRDRVVNRGTDVDGHRFPDLTQKWLRFKKRSGKWAGFTNYNWTGELWGSFRILITSKGKGKGKLGFGGMHSTHSKTKRLRNQRLADLLAQHARPGSFQETNSRPPHPFTEITQAEGDELAREYERQVLGRKLAGLPPALRMQDIPAHLHKWVEVGK